MNRRLVMILATTTGLTVANLWYSQPLLPQIAHQFRVSAQQIGLLPMLTLGGYALGLLLLVPLGDVVERRRLILTLLSLVTAALLAVAAAPTFFWLCVTTFVMGVTTVVPQIILPFAALLAPPAQRGRTVGRVMSGLLIGLLLSRVVGGIVGTLWGWRAIYEIAAGVMLLLALFLRSVLPRSAPLLKLPYVQLLRSLAQITRDLPQLRLAALNGCLIFITFGGFWTTLAFWLASPVYGYGGDVAGLFGLVGAAGAVTAPIVGRLADHRSPDWLVGLGTLLVLAAYCLFGAVGAHLWGLSIGVVILDIGAQVAHVSNQTRIYSLLPDARSRLNTVYMTLYMVGMASGSYVGSFSWHLAKWNGVCCTGIVVLVIALVIHYLAGMQGLGDAGSRRASKES